jgi:hypothetical protein
MELTVLALVLFVIVAGIGRSLRKKRSTPKGIARPESTGSSGYVPPMPDDEITDALAVASQAAKNKE